MGQAEIATAVAGGGSAPSPAWLFRAGYASCVPTLISLRAAVEGVELTGLEVTVDSESDDRGILGIDPSVPAGPLSVRSLSASPRPAPTRAGCGRSSTGAGPIAR
jgi:hypothetical protein